MALMVASCRSRQSQSRAAAQHKLAERRAKAVAQQKQELANTGVDVAIIEEIALERAQIDEEEAAAVLELEAEADAEESNSCVVLGVVLAEQIRSEFGIRRAAQRCST